MRPAFSSTKQAAAFAILLLVTLALPSLMGKTRLPARAEIYMATPGVLGPYHYLHRQIFEETNDVDIAFIGSSRVMHDIETPLVQQALSRKLGRPAVVVTLGWDWAGFDADYFITRDLLDHRKVKMIVFSEESRVGDNPHHAAPRWFRWGEDAETLTGLPVQLRVPYYFGSVVGMPRNLLSLVRPNYPDWTPVGSAVWRRDLEAPDPDTTLGSVLSQLVYDHKHGNFTEFRPAANGLTSGISVYSEATKNQFQFSSQPLSRLQAHFARKFGELASGKGCQLVYVHLPETDEMRLTQVQEKTYWPDVLGANVTMLGIPPRNLFQGLSDVDILKLYLDPYHFNQNGMDFFTPLLIPTLLESYDAKVEH